MDQTFREVLQSLVNESTENKLKLAMSAFADIQPELEKLDPDHKGLLLLFGIISPTVAADGTMSREEFAMVAAFCKVLGMELEDGEVVELIKNFNVDQSVDMMKALKRTLDSDKASALVLFVGCICSIDDTISSDEINLLEDLLNA